MGFLTGSAKRRKWDDGEQAAQDTRDRNNNAAMGVQQQPTGVTKRETDATGYGGGGQDVYYDKHGSPGVAVGPSSGQKELQRYRSLGEAAANRDAYQGDFSAAQADRGNSLQARGKQVEASNMQRDAAMGLAPSRAAIMGNQAAGQSLEGTLGATAGARGPGLAAASMAAQRGQGAALLGGQQQFAGQRAQEMADARGQFSSGLNTIRSGDYTNMSLAQDQAEAQAKSEIAQRHLNQTAQMGYEQMGVNVEQAELDASIRNAAVANANNATANATSDARNARAQKLGWAGVSAIGSLAASDSRTKQGARKLSFSDAHAKKEAYELGLRDGGGGEAPDRKALAKAWDEGHNEALARMQDMRKMSPDELKALGEKGNRIANAVRGTKADAWDEAKGASPHIMQPLKPPRQMESFEREQPELAQPAAPAPVAMSDERAKRAEAMLADIGAQRDAQMDRGPAVGERPRMSDAEAAKLREQADGMMAGDRAQLADGPSVGRSPPSWLRDEMEPGDDSMKRRADEMLGTQRAQSRASLDDGPSVKGDDMGKALADMKPYEYEYKDQYRGAEGQVSGEKNVGPMAQDMAKNPITGSAVVKRPDGMLAVDMTKAGKLSLGAIGYLASKQRKQEAEIARLKKGGR